METNSQVYLSMYLNAASPCMLLLHVFGTIKQWVFLRWGQGPLNSMSSLPTASRHRTDALELNEWMGDHWETRRFESGVGGGVELQGVGGWFCHWKNWRKWRSGRLGVIHHSNSVYTYHDNIISMIIIIRCSFVLA